MISLTDFSEQGIYSDITLGNTVEQRCYPDFPVYTTNYRLSGMKRVEKKKTEKKEKKREE